jgi:DNA replication protein DnaC
LHGPTRAGKTRTMYQLMQRLVWEDRSIEVLLASQFKRKYADAVMSGKADAWIEKVSRCDALFIDDLGQTKMTEASEEGLLEVLELRSQHLRPTFVTTQYVGEELVAQFLRPQRGQAVLMRLREFCEAVPMGEPRRVVGTAVPSGQAWR